MEKLPSVRIQPFEWESPVTLVLQRLLSNAKGQGPGSTNQI